MDTHATTYPRRCTEAEGRTIGGTGCRKRNQRGGQAVTIKSTLPIDRERAILAYRNFLWALGYDFLALPSMNATASGKDTAERHVDAMIEFLTKQQEHFDVAVFPADGSPGIVAATHLTFHSLCCHHMLPFYGVAHIGYIPRDKVAGLSKLVRILDHYAHRPAIQEQIGNKVATFIMEQLLPMGCGVVIEAMHTCMSMRGVERPGHITVTSDVRGVFKEAAVRQEFMSMIERGRR